MLRKEISTLQQRYGRAKGAVKSAYERIGANNRKKEEYLRTTKSRKQEDIIEQSNSLLVQCAYKNIHLIYYMTNAHNLQ